MGQNYPLRLVLVATLFLQVTAFPHLDGEFPNLISDLAPLLALFGEQAAKQFMSESMGWTDNIIFAMAPLGILTAVVGAIRVGGLSWLKAIIGRARENRAVAEVEFMTSTSHEVCELWDGQQIVKRIGSPPVKEILWFSPLDEPFAGDKGRYLFSRDQAVVDGFLVGNGKHYQKGLQGSRIFLESDAENQNPGYHLVSPENLEECAPNISLNLHDRIGRTELRTMAAIAIVLQSGILIYGALATYYPILDHRVVGLSTWCYGFPAFALGTAFLSAGLFICAHVIQSSTIEGHYQVPSEESGTEAHVLWLQKAQTIADQSFESFAIFAKDVRKVITTSRRKPGWDVSEGDSLQLKTGVFVTLGTIFTLCGFFLQFAGLRGMHCLYSAGSLTAPPCTTTSPGFELEWLATRSPGFDHHWPKEKSSSKRFRVSIRHSWSKSFKAPECLVDEDEDEFWSERFWGPSRSGAPSFRQGAKVLNKLKEIRMRLGALTGWRSLVSDEAESVASAMDIVLNTLFPSSLDNFPWSFQTQALGNDGVDINVKRNSDGRWETNVSEIDAILSLWLYAVHRDEKLAQPTQPPGAPSQDDNKSKKKRSKAQSIRFLGSDTVSLRRDLRWWVDRGSARVIIAEEIRDRNTGSVGQRAGGKKQDNEEIRIERHRVLGRGEVMGQGSSLEYTVRELSEVFQAPVGSTLPTAAGSSPSPNSTGPRLATLSDAPLTLAFAQELFAAFMWAATEKYTGPITGMAKIHHTDIDIMNDGSSWQSFTLQNSTLLKMAQDVQGTGLGSLQEAYLSIIPPLSVRGCLPDTSAIVDLARTRAERHELCNNWRKSADIYLWLFRTGLSFDPSRYVARKSVAVLLEFFRSVIIAAKISTHQGLESPVTIELMRVKLEIEEEIRSCEKGYFSDFMKLYTIQRRTKGYGDLEPQDWEPLAVGTGFEDDMPEFDILQSLRVGLTRLHYDLLDPQCWGSDIPSENFDDATDILGFSALHYLASRSRWPENIGAVSDNSTLADEWFIIGARTISLLQAGADGNAKDLAGWTPLHHCALANNINVLKRLLQEGVDVDARARDAKTPLHYAAISGNHEVASLLIEAGASMEALDASRNTPLHWAAYYGHCEVAQVLLPVGDLRIRNNEGRTPSHLAALAGMYAVFGIIFKEGVNEGRDRAGCTVLHLAAAGGNTDIVKLLIGQTDNKGGLESNEEQKPPDFTIKRKSKTFNHPSPPRPGDMEAKDNYGRRPLHWAAKSVGAATGFILVKGGARIEAKDKGGQTALHTAVERGNEELVRLLINEGAAVNVTDRRGWKPIHMAASEGNGKLVRVLVEEGVDVDMKDGIGRTALYCMTKEGNLEMVRVLIKQGADVKAKDSAGWTPLDIAAIGCNEELIRALIKGGADVNATDPGGETVLHGAMRKDERILALFLDHGADIESKDKGGRTILHIAAQRGLKDKIIFLFDRGADKNAKDNKGRTALHYAANYLNIYYSDPSGEKAAERAAIVIKFLLSQGFNRNVRDNDGKTALDMARESGRGAVAQILETT